MKISNGEISAEVFDFMHDIDISSVNGGVTVYLDLSLNANIEVRTFNGGISVNDIPLHYSILKDNHIEGTLGSGGSKLYIHTVNGNVVLNKLTVL